MSQCHFVHHPTSIDPGANPGLRGERPATNDLSHGTANLHVRTTYEVEVGIWHSVYFYYCFYHFRGMPVSFGHGGGSNSGHSYHSEFVIRSQVRRSAERPVSTR
jgi:hypothetical protein